VGADCAHTELFEYCGDSKAPNVSKFDDELVFDKNEKLGIKGKSFEQK